MKLKKIFKKIAITLPLVALPTVGISYSYNNNSTKIVRNVDKYNFIHKKLWDHLNIKNNEFIYEPIKIGIIDGGLVDSNFLKFNNNTISEIDLKQKYYLKNNPNRLNKNNVIYNQQENTEIKKTFEDAWKDNKHATEIASIIGSDSGIFKNAVFYSTTYNENGDESDLEILRRNLEFFKNNNVKFINMSYGFANFEEWTKFFYKVSHQISNKNINFEDLKKYNDNLKNAIELNWKLDYEEQAALLDEYAYKEDMKFFISVGNSKIEFPKIKEMNKKMISIIENYFLDNKSINFNIKAILNSILEKSKLITNDDKLFLKQAKIKKSKNTFIIGAYNMNDGKIENFSEGNMLNWRNSPLGVAPDKFSKETLLLNDQYFSTKTSFDDPSIYKWSGTSFSAPVVLTLSALISKLNNKEYKVAELKAALLASFKLSSEEEKNADQYGYGKISWDRLKFYINKVRKIEKKDLVDGYKFDSGYMNRTKRKYLFVFSNLAVVHESLPLENPNSISKYFINDEEAKKYISPFNVILENYTALSSKKMYELTRLTGYGGIEWSTHLKIYENATKKIGSYEPSIPMKYKIHFQKEKKYSYFTEKVIEKGLYYILDTNEITQEEYIPYE
ncbi:S8 family serine peptidase [Mesomycoplasma lagogenitalium]|uniref:S8 family serine peptidase n=1 Tax=Mesomycoplasma lagogenitalium TaxID=171286 RepID=A0ABY8LWH9_9BACT|nr:S8 family serine peptidase [Mesomycoplasma lagogenitalium]WGI36781.1 S8 family serine peptidase [Mesomycoplasma lagogenitalium]